MAYSRIGIQPGRSYLQDRGVDVHQAVMRLKQYASNATMSHVTGAPVNQSEFAMKRVSCQHEVFWASLPAPPQKEYSDLMPA
jgi:hypothetical protein